MLRAELCDQRSQLLAGNQVDLVDQQEDRAIEFAHEAKNELVLFALLLRLGELALVFGVADSCEYAALPESAPVEAVG